MEDLILQKGAPEDMTGRLERETSVYALLDKLNISYDRIDHEPADNMEACERIDAALETLICKNLFLCNRQQTDFYLLMMPADKVFKTKDLSKQIGSARLSFADAEHMEEYLHIKPGAVSVMGLMNDTGNNVQLLIDRVVIENETVGCHPCVCTSSLRLLVKDVLEVFLPAVHHEPVIVDLPVYKEFKITPEL